MGDRVHSTAPESIQATANACSSLGPAESSLRKALTHVVRITTLVRRNCRGALTQRPAVVRYSFATVEVLLAASVVSFPSCFIGSRRKILDNLLGTKFEPAYH